MANAYNFRGKAISIAQPWASAVAFAGKEIENRSWRTHCRVPIAIHASMTFSVADMEEPVRTLRGGEKRPLAFWIDRGRRRWGLDASGGGLDGGAIIAIAMLVDCVDRSSSPWFRGEWGWVLQGVVPIEPLPRGGRLGLWDCHFKYRPAARKSSK